MWKGIILVEKMGEIRNQVFEYMRDAVKTEGSYNPDKILYLFEEKLTNAEFFVCEKFLSWVHENKKTFGSNIKEVFADWIKKNEVS